MPKFSSSLVVLALALSQNVDAFSFQANRGVTPTKHQTTSLYATVEKSVLKPPSDIPDDNIPELFEKFVQKTYG